jgi:hypothetical protein
MWGGCVHVGLDRGEVYAFNLVAIRLGRLGVRRRDVPETWGTPWLCIVSINQRVVLYATYPFLNTISPCRNQCPTCASVA